MLAYQAFPQKSVPYRFSEAGTARMSAIAPGRSTGPQLPARYTNLDSAHSAHGSRIHAFAPALVRGDPLADDLVEYFASRPLGGGRKQLEQALDHGIESVRNPHPTLAALFAQLDHVPLWVDFKQLDLGGSVYLRLGPLGQLALGCAALPLAYGSPVGVVPLVFTGRLTQRAFRRLIETTHFVYVTCKPGGLRRHGEGFKTTVRVRLMHAQIRRLLRQSPKWDMQAWGVPIPQADLAGTNLSFSVVVLESLRRLGCSFSARESEAVMHLWRYSGYLIGLEPQFTCATEAEALRMGDLIAMTQGPPNGDCVALTQALMNVTMHMAQTPAQRRAAQQWRKFLNGLTRYFIGAERADALQLPKTRLRFALYPMRLTVMLCETLRRTVPGVNTLAVRIGSKTWGKSIEIGLAGVKVSYELPEHPAARSTH